jgi:hypothetical protein
VKLLPDARKDKDEGLSFMTKYFSQSYLALLYYSPHPLSSRFSCPVYLFVLAVLGKVVETGSLINLRPSFESVL